MEYIVKNQDKRACKTCKSKNGNKVVLLSEATAVPFEGCTGKKCRCYVALDVEGEGVASNKKNIWDIAPEDIVLLGGKRYRWLKDIRKRMPTLGVVPNRVLVNVDDPKDTNRWFLNSEVEIEDLK